MSDVANASLELFQTLRNFRLSPAAGKSPTESLVEYCSDILGSIERVHFDFKEKSDPSHPKLDNSDKRNLAKAISGFANSGGGVLIWGIEDSSMHPKPIHSIGKFIESILQISHQASSPAVKGIDGDYIPGGADDGFGIIYIPESDLPPHRVVLNIADIQNHYYVRSGTSFTAATHPQLEDMFGRRPRPKLVVDFRVVTGMSSGDKAEVGVVVSLTNQGRGVAKYPFLSLEVNEPHGISRWGVDGNGHHGLPIVEAKNRGDSLFASAKFGTQGGIVIHSGMTLEITKAKATVFVNGDSEMSDLKIKHAIAAEGIPLTLDEKVIPASELAKLVAERRSR